MYCDSAYLYDDDKRFEAFSNVRINQGDTIKLNGDRLDYSGTDKTARVNGNVKLFQNGMTLTTAQLDYNLKNKKAYYSTPGKIINKETRINSNEGTYTSATKIILFRRNVKLYHPDYIIFTDTMRYNTETEISDFYGPTTIVTKDTDTIYCQYGFFDSKKDISRFSKNSYIISKEQKLAADSIIYNRKTRIGLAYRNINFSDKKENIYITGDTGIYNEITKIALVNGHPLARQVADSDTIYIRADTLIYVGDSLPEKKLLRAFGKAKIFKSDIQAIADSIVYTFSDSASRLFHDPVLWSKQNQLTADTIYIFTKNNKPEYIDLLGNSFISSKEKKNHFNQVKGKYIKGWFEESELYKVDVKKNGESIYYIKEDSNHYSSINKISCNDMVIYIKKREVTGIKFFKENKGTMYPINSKKPEELRLKGYTWREKERPLKKEDLNK